jgi:hypothetical protein
VKERTVARLAGLLAVIRLLFSAADHYVTARLGWPPLAWVVRQVAAVVREAYRLGRFGPLSTRRELAVIVYEGEVLEEEGDRHG